MNEDENVVDPSHPRYESLMLRKKVADAGLKGMLADSAMIAHGRGEAFDYLLGEQTIPSALEATREGCCEIDPCQKTYPFSKRERYCARRTRLLDNR